MAWSGVSGGLTKDLSRGEKGGLRLRRGDARGKIGACRVTRASLVGDDGSAREPGDETGAKHDLVDRASFFAFVVVVMVVIRGRSDIC